MNADPHWTEHYERFLKSHLGLLAICGAVFLVWRVGWHAIDRSADKAIADASAKVEAAKAQAGINAELAAKAQQDAASYKQLVAQVLASNAALAQGIVTRNANTQQQQAQVRIEPLPSVAVRWSQLLDLAPGDIAVAGNTLAVSEPSARTTVIALEAGQACTANLSDTEQRCSNDEARIVSCDATVASCQAEVAGLNVEIKKNNDAADAVVKKLNDTHRASVLKWSERAFGAGSILTLIGLAALGVL